MSVLAVCRCRLNRDSAAGGSTALLTTTARAVSSSPHHSTSPIRPVSKQFQSPAAADNLLHNTLIQIGILPPPPRSFIRRERCALPVSLRPAVIVHGFAHEGGGGGGVRGGGLVRRGGHLRQRRPPRASRRPRPPHPPPVPPRSPPFPLSNLYRITKASVARCLHLNRLCCCPQPEPMCRDTFRLCFMIVALALSIKRAKACSK